MSFRTKYLIVSVFIFSLVTFGIFELTRKNARTRIDTILSGHLKSLQIHYNIFLYNQKRLADQIFEQTMLDDEIVRLMEEAYLHRGDTQALSDIREKLRVRLARTYKIYKKNDLLQYHFVFPDNVSFLRMHKPDKYGDDLTGIREDFEKANTTFEPVHGFTQGRVAHAFRNAYPLFDSRGNHIGAFEASFPTELLQKYLNEISAIHSHFLIHKRVFDAKAWKRNDLILNYRQSQEHPDFMVTMLGRHNGSECLGMDVKQEELRSWVRGEIDKGKPFIHYFEKQHRIRVVTFLPIRQAVSGKTVAWIAAYKEDPVIHGILTNMYIAQVVLILMTLFTLFIIYRQKRLEHSLKDEKGKALDATRAKSEFLANMSHEIRTPMNGIIGLSHLVLHGELPPKQRRYVEKIDHSAKMLLVIINDILDVSKIEAGKLSIEKEPFDLFRAVDAVVDNVTVQTRDKGLELLVGYDPALGRCFEGDSLRLSQILSNLIANAVKFTDAGEIGLMITKVREGRCRFEVVDTGIGMTAEQQKKLFRPFS